METAAQTYDDLGPRYGLPGGLYRPARSSLPRLERPRAVYHDWASISSKNSSLTSGIVFAQPGIDGDRSSARGLRGTLIRENLERPLRVGGCLHFRICEGPRRCSCQPYLRGRAPGPCCCSGSLSRRSRPSSWRLSRFRPGSRLPRSAGFGSDWRSGCLSRWEQPWPRGNPRIGRGDPRA